MPSWLARCTTVRPPLAAGGARCTQVPGLQAVRLPREHTEYAQACSVDRNWLVYWSYELPQLYVHRVLANCTIARLEAALHVALATLRRFRGLEMS